MLSDFLPDPLEVVEGNGGAVYALFDALVLNEVVAVDSVFVRNASRRHKTNDVIVSPRNEKINVQPPDFLAPDDVGHALRLQTHD